ncbi:hypothetical protein P262_04515 [Cronobacter malonaticus]|uniref:Uncharacterized protein n=1 Tax=Cronobacter malonaticus TaxID=413503 RepID=V5TYC1_9ENTR|nr:hypothetical protein [Cronobacter malonaticus]AHB69564.1 hypothetical protein P262_01686 [Cronobacter malonaticus]AHB71586.1 hypothetical protein P262_04515 [Cronobacter malonaticus]NCH31156.1 hypothetical protein [Cronobacter malonaticus]
MSGYSIYNIISGGCIGALIMTLFMWRQEKRHRSELTRIREEQIKSQQQVIAEIKSIYRNAKG